MAQLHFDILLIMFLTFSVLFSWWKGAYKSLRFFLAIMLTFLVLEIFSANLFDYLSSINHLQIVDGLTKWMSFLPTLFENRFSIMIFLVYIIVYFAMWLVISLIMLPFKKNRENSFTYQPKKWKKFASMLLGLLNGIVLVYVFVGGMHYIVPIEGHQILTSTMINNTGQFTSVQLMNQLHFEVEPLYAEFQSFEDGLKGYRFKKSYEELSEIKERVYEIDHLFENELIPLFQNPLSVSLIASNLPEDLYDVRGYTFALVHMDSRKTNYELILDQEYTNPQKEIIEEHLTWILQHQLFIKILFQLGMDFEDMTVTELSETIASLESTIYRTVHKSADIRKYREITRDIRYYEQTRNYFRGLVDIDTNLSEESQQSALKNALLSTTSLTQIATNFQSTYATQEFYQEFELELKTGDRFFSKVLEYINELVPKDYLYLSSGILSKEYPALQKVVEKYNTKTWLNAFINDGLGKQENQINRLYFLQFFLHNWFSTYNLVQPIPSAEFQAILTKIDTDIQTNHYFTLSAIEAAFTYFIYDAQGIKYLYETGVFTLENMESMISNDWTFISPEAQNHLQTILE